MGQRNKSFDSWPSFYFFPNSRWGEERKGVEGRVVGERDGGRNEEGKTASQFSFKWGVERPTNHSG